MQKPWLIYIYIYIYISDTLKSVRKRFEETQVVMVANAMLIFDVRHVLAVYNIEVRWGECMG